MWKRCRRRPRQIADNTTTLFPLTNTVWNQPDTLFPHSLRTVRTQKQRFLHHSVWSNARNAVFATKPKGESKETTCTADSMRIIIGNNVEVA